MNLRFSKMHGIGNDFVVIDAVRQHFDPTPGLIALLANRRMGVGCDQVLVVDPPPGDDVDFGYRIYNADGTQSGQCGNGARCLAKFIRHKGLSSESRLRVRTLTRTLDLEHLASGHIRVDMGVPDFEPSSIPLEGPLRAPRYGLDLGDTRVILGAVSMGNPHAVIEVDNLDDTRVTELAPRIQAHAQFPLSVNVGFLQAIGKTRGRLRVYERGSGETLACGSGACAAMAVGRLWGKFGERVTMQLTGGELVLEWSGDGAALYMTGPAQLVYEGEIDWQPVSASPPVMTA